MLPRRRGPGRYPAHFAVPALGPAPAAKDCPRLPESARVLVNGVVADVVDPGGPSLGGPDGTTFLACKREAFAEVGPLTRAEVANVRVSLEEAGRVAEATLGDLVTEPKLRAAAPAQVKIGAELVLAVDLPYNVRLSYAELAQTDGGRTHRRGGPAFRVLRNDDLHCWVSGRPGPATLTLSGETYTDRESVAHCDGFTTCEITRTVLLGPLTVELTP
jgi:hypothetical protein